ncbi:hypothetical protein C8F04DRAFT_1080304, partial [Mycena alexandri]
RFMSLRRLFRRFPCSRKTRTKSPAGSNENPSCVSDGARKSKRKNYEPIPTAAAATARNTLKFALQTLSVASTHIPLGSVVSAAIEPLLVIIDRVEQTSSNARGLLELAMRIDLLAPIVSEMVKNPRGITFIQGLHRELQSITEDLEIARSQGKLHQFFNSVHNASSLQKHNITLSQLIAESTLVTVHEVLKSVHGIERQLDVASTFELGDITGGLGGPGSSGSRIGGQGGEGEGPEIEMDTEYRWKLGNISGGTGGPGGSGVEVGGQGGVGKGPVISISCHSNVGRGSP